jgi:phosphoglycerol transferase MdoB-like AlkP superfamily enzyme
LFLALLLLSLTRIVFWVVNHSQFPWEGFFPALNVLFFGAYFDLISLFYCLSPFILLHLIPGTWFFNPNVQKGLRIFYSVILFLIITLTCIDAGYFPFSKARLGIELFQMAAEEDISITTYILDYWWFIPIILSLVYLSWKFFPKPNNISTIKWFFQVPINILFLGLLLLTIRGGLRLKPLRSIDTALFVPSPFASLAISSGFNFLESLQVETIKVPTYFSDNQMKQILESDYHEIKQSSNVKPKNIVILILESFGEEYSFPDTKDAISYTPFLQELSKQSTRYTQAYSNGTRSVDAIPAILEGVPKLTKTDFMYSNYIKNTTPGFPHYLKDKGYSCAFYHGGKNGTLGFEAFLKSRGWEYYGKDQFSGREQDFDGQWGIYDGPYLQYVAKQISKTKAPFVVSVFTLSSHHPYTLPPEYKDSFKSIKQPIHQTVRYTDNCLKQFFEVIKNEPWFQETIFIITGDHSSENFTKRYQGRDSKFEVPILVFDPSNPIAETLPGIIQHIDIVPLALQKAGFTGKIMTLGTWFNPNSQKLAFQNEDGNYQIISDFSTLTFDGSKPQYKLLSELIGKNTAVLTEEFLVQQLKSKIQDYNYRLVNNKLF